MPIPSVIQQFIDRQADAATTSYDDLRAVVFNGTLKRSPEPSQTDGLLAISRGILERVGVQVDVIRTVDHVIPPGVWPDMTTQGYERDDFPRHLPRARRAGGHHPHRRADLAGRPELPDTHDHRAPVRVLR